MKTPLDINDRLSELLELPESQQDVLRDFAETLFRLFWHVSLSSPSRSQEIREITAALLVPFAFRHLGHEFEKHILHEWAVKFADDFKTLEFLHALSVMPFEDFVKEKMFPDPEADEDDEIRAVFREVWLGWKPRIIKLTPGLVSYIRTVNEEYLTWMQHHPDVLDKIAWEAFEQIVAEIFSSKGFRVDLTGRLRNRSADIIAIRSDEFGVETKYLIECKRYTHSTRVGLDIVNGVIGAARRADADHAFLITSSFFTKDVYEQKQDFQQLRLHLRDGDDVREWLRNYKVRTESGLWLSPGWEDNDQLIP